MNGRYRAPATGFKEAGALKNGRETAGVSWRILRKISFTPTAEREAVTSKESQVLV